MKLKFKQFGIFRYGGWLLKLNSDKEAELPKLISTPTNRFEMGVKFKGKLDERPAVRNVKDRNFTLSDVGKVICQNGNIYDNMAQAKADGQYPIAMIAYIGNLNGNSGKMEYSDSLNQGIAISLYSVGVDGSFDETSESTVSPYSQCDLLTQVEDKCPVNNEYMAWDIPTPFQFQRIFIGCGSSDEFSDGWLGPFDMGNIRNLLKMAGNKETDYEIPDFDEHSKLITSEQSIDGFATYRIDTTDFNWEVSCVFRPILLF